jgi:hypothetical protein
LQRFGDVVGAKVVAPKILVDSVAEGVETRRVNGSVDTSIAQNCE